MTYRSVIQIVFVMFLWAICYPLITIGITLAPHLSFAALRALIAGSALLALAFWLRRPLPRGVKTWLSILTIGVGATGLGFFGMFHAAEFVSPGIATVIASTQPLFAAVLAGFVLKEKLTSMAKLGLGIGFFGIVFIVTPNIVSQGAENYLLGVSFVVLAALGVTVSNVIIKQLADDVDAFMAMGFQILLGSLPLILLAFTMENPGEIEWHLEFVASLLGLSLLGTALVYWMWFNILQRVPLSHANAFSFLVPIMGLFMGVIFFGEEVEGLAMFGIALTLTGVGIIIRDGTQSGDAAPAYQAT